MDEDKQKEKTNIVIGDFQKEENLSNTVQPAPTPFQTNPIQKNLITYIQNKVLNKKSKSHFKLEDLFR